MKMFCHDPRISSDPDHKVETENTALQMAECARQAIPDRPVDWLTVQMFADYCDAPATAADPAIAELTTLVICDQVRIGGHCMACNAAPGQACQKPESPEKSPEWRGKAT